MDIQLTNKLTDVLLRKSKSVCTILCLALATTAQADIICSGVVQNVGFEADGLLSVNFGFGTNQICYVDKNTIKTMAYYNTTTITMQYCQALLANFITAKENRKPIQMYFGTATCPTGQALPQFPYAIYF
jgi:hypothetical protein